MEQLEALANSIKQVPCSEDGNCRNSPANSSHPRCNECRLSPNPKNKWFSTGLFDPIKGNWKEHPILKQESRDEKRRQAIERQAKRKAKDPIRKARLKASARAEQRTNESIIKSTKNSGRQLNDGDHLFNGNILLDTKQQSKSLDPIVHLHELDKSRRQAQSKSMAAGGLVLRNSKGRGVVVFAEEDLTRIISKGKG